MTTTQLLIRWFAIALLTIVSGLWQGKTIGPNLLLIAVLSATAMTGLAALHPLTKRPGWSGFGLAWLHHFLVFILIATILIGSPLRISIIMSFLASTLSTIAGIP